MPRVSATASMGVKLKIFSDYENASSMASITYEDDCSSAAEMEALGDQLYQKARAYVENKIGEDIESAKGRKFNK